MMHTNAVLFGVCAKTAERFRCDVRSLRLAAVIAAVLDPLCVVGAVYLLTAVLMRD